MKRRTIFLIILGIFLAGLIFVSYSLFTGSPITEADIPRFVVPLRSTDAEVIEKLKAENFVRSAWPISLAISLRGDIEPGGYKVSRTMSPWQMAGVLTQGPYMKWVIIPEGLRKEEIADILADKLSWDTSTKNDWINKYTSLKYDYVEGVYFPDTYLIPVDEEPLKVAERLQAKFQEKFAPYAKEALKQNIKWDTALKLASIVQREAAGKDDMPLIAGILWNRLLKNMKLDIDATLQYIKGTSEDWWPKITPADKQLDSPYNTYKHAGLPPHPISNPGLSAIEAVLHPTKTECLYYLHDSGGQIRCSKTYEEHQQNIDTYLK